MKVPQVSRRAAGEFILTCTRGGKEVFREVKPVSVLDPNAGPKPSLGKTNLVMLDPLGSVKERLQARGIAFTEAASAAEIPAKAKVVVIGKDALSAREATDPKWTALAGNGAKVLVLDQAHPLHYQATPSDLAPTDFVGRVAFEENTEHPIFSGLEQDDFFTWSKDHVGYRNVYAKPTRGATSLAHCDKELSYSAIAECPVNLKYPPLPLGEHCNQYLSKDRGWFAGTRDLSHLPVGANVLAGVPYVVRDFKTSPVPSCVMLAGPGAKGQLPKEVQDIPAGCKADMLFFLHAFGSRDPGRRVDPAAAAPVAFRYSVHYADGQTAEIPVLLGEGVDHWISSKPAGLKSAALAWSARFPGDKSEDEAVVYQFASTNPRADVAISSIDMAYGKDGDSCGTPALLAVTAAKAP